jgi:hypothetical protein
MGKTTMTKEFLNMTRILLLGANPTINLNNIIIKSFEINWGVSKVGVPHFTLLFFHYCKGF